MNEKIEPMDHDEGGGISRRDVLKKLGVAGFAVAAGPTFLAACGSSSKKSNANSSGTTAAGSSTSSGNVGDRLKKLLNVDPANAGQNVNFTMGAVLALSGTGSFYGKTMSRGIDLAVKHIQAAGGPKISVVYKDHKSGDAQAGQTAITELGSQGVPA